ncbi:TPA: type II secretion system protein J [Vibrio vulnificus]|uniref:PulJ/GspJ family protein n=1 Tax=Vibrio TaxID=662 RepID=UPI00057740D4|nr:MULTISPECIES: prepilin-type N-terminal cleavage/methylation domain-containing protein [Vibrio]
MQLRTFSKKRGFTLIEVLVALAILAAGLTASMRLFQQVSLSSLRAEQVQEQLLVEKSIYQSLLRTNPAQKSDGREQLGDIAFTWQARAISPVLQLRSETGLNPNYTQIYIISVNYLWNKKTYQFEFELLGWEKR